MPHFKATYGFQEYDQLALSMERHCPRPGSALRSTSCARLHHYDLAAGSLVRDHVDVERFIARAYERGLATAFAECFRFRSNEERRRRGQPVARAPYWSPLPPIGFGDEEWSVFLNGQAAAVAEAEAAAEAAAEEAWRRRQGEASHPQPEPGPEQPEPPEQVEQVGRELEAEEAGEGAGGEEEEWDPYLLEPGERPYEDFDDDDGGVGDDFF
jgi:hypothetical protein